MPTNGTGVSSALPCQVNLACTSWRLTLALLPFFSFARITSRSSSADRCERTLETLRDWGILLQRPVYVSDVPAEKKATLRAKRNRPAPPLLPMLRQGDGAAGMIIYLSLFNN